MTPNDPVTIDYTNWRGLRKKRPVVFTGEMRFGSTDYHKEPQWLFSAFCLESGEVREFALTGLHGVEAAPHAQSTASQDNVLTLGSTIAGG